MTKGRLEAFSDGVIAIIITIMVLELKVPHDPSLAALGAMWPVMVCYVLSFVYVGIYWNNHHHMLHMATRVNGGILWANLHLLFWLSLVPFVTGWMGENHFPATPTAIYGVVMLMAGFAYFLLQNAIIRDQGANSRLKAAVGRDVKSLLSIAGYAAAIPLAFLTPWASVACYAVVAGMWLVPDKRIEVHLVDARE
ncbi:MAG: TMEM175 family protein [Deltaproteobacteria bacterium]|nr:TMEM175 family protein [Deltaproteobacteria bacterium]